MPSLATTNRFQQIDQKSIQTFMALSDLTVGHIRGYHGSKPMSILNVVILVRCPRINWTVSGGLVGRTPWSARDALVPLLEPRCQPPARHGRPTRASAADQGVRPTKGVKTCPVNSWTPH